MKQLASVGKYCKNRPLLMISCNPAMMEARNTVANGSTNWFVATVVVALTNPHSTASMFSIPKSTPPTSQSGVNFYNDGNTWVRC